MSDETTQRRFEELLPRVRRPARLTGGEVGSTAGFTTDPGELRVVLAFPDTYEIGISNQALQILYGLAKRSEGVAVERTYLPWVDAIAEMRERQIGLLTLESWSPVVTADVLGVTLQHESNLTNLLEILDLAGMPLRAADRDRDHPLVIVGGPACANFLPVSAFVDAVVVGDGEEVSAQLLKTLTEAKRGSMDRTEAKRSLSGLDGVFVPGVSGDVQRQCVSRLVNAPYPADCLVPLTEGVHDRAWVEVMRGCTRGCRFCQAGMWYRPVRERPVDQVLAMTEAQISATGYQEVALASLSTTDHSDIERLLTETAAAHPELQVSLPSLRVDGAAIRLSGLTSPTGPSITLAPEAGSQRMRDVINKNVTEADILGAVQEAVRSGKTTVKLYFMIGLPWEEDEDARAIADLCLGIRDLARESLGPKANRLRMNVSVNNFIPKPFTPFQWAGMVDRATLVRRQGIIRDSLRKPGVKVSFSSTDSSYLETALARGGESMGDVIEDAWRRGARLDSWTEHFKGEAWEHAFENAGLSMERLATTAIEPDASLPWDVIEGAVDKDFLLAEWERAERGEMTPDCRWDECSECGVCRDGLANDLVASGHGVPCKEGASEESDPQAARPGAERRVASGDEGAGASERRRYVATFSVEGRGRFMGHLDRAEVFRRAVRRAGGRLALSAGMRPKALLSLALPLAVGAEGRRELAQFELAAPADEGFASRLDEALPEHTHLLDLRPYEGKRTLAARVVGVSYEVAVAVTGGEEGASGRLREAVRRFGESEKLPVEEVRQGTIRRVDVKMHVDSVRLEEGAEGGYVLSFEARFGPAGTARPERVVDAVAALSGLELAVRRVTRTEIALAEEEG